MNCFKEFGRHGEFELGIVHNGNAEVGMILELKLRKVGNSVGVVLPKEALAHMNVAEGDKVTLTEAQDGVRLTASNPEFAKTMAVFESLNRHYRNTLGELAK